MSLTEEQEYAYQLILNKKNVFITAPGGFGKTFFINEICKRLSGKKIGKTSMTGSSAILINGTTLHSYLGIGICSDTMDMLKRVYKTKKQHIWNETELLIIDEVSMMSKEFFESLDYIGKQICNNPRPFGGIQLLLSGDFCQLGCIGSSFYCFESDFWNKYIHYTIKFTKSFRHDEDMVFSKMLEKIRFGIIDNEIREALESRIIEYDSSSKIQPTRLYSHKRDVSEINEKFLNELNTPLKTYTCKIKDKYITKKSKYLNDVPIVKLRVGAQVILTVNLDIENGLINGSRGIVTSFSLKGLPIVEFLNGMTLEIDYFTHTIEEKSIEVFSYSCIPLILGWAITIHKSQGMTLDCVIADLGSIFEYGQGYVTLSRVKSLDSLYIVNIRFDKIKCNPKVIEFYKMLD